MDFVFRVFDFNVYNEKPESDSSDEETKYKETASFMIQIFGVNEKGEDCSIIAENYKPFFYVLVDDDWTISKKNDFVTHLTNEMGKFYHESICDSKLLKRKKLYGFNDGKEYKFIKLEFNSLTAFNKAKNLWYTSYKEGHYLKRNGYNSPDGLYSNIKLYEANIPPLLRFFHIKDISPSGWIAIPKKKAIMLRNESKKTHCDYEFVINYKNILPLNNKETRVPFKICSFDIEASSSHGDFPLPEKDYKKLATNILEYFENTSTEISQQKYGEVLNNIILTAFGYENEKNIDLIYTKNPPKARNNVENLSSRWLSMKMKEWLSNNKLRDMDMDMDMDIDMNRDIDDIADNAQEYDNTNTLAKTFGSHYCDDADENDDDNADTIKRYKNYNANIIDILCDKKFPREGKINEVNLSLSKVFPAVEGDKVTFIGSTFMKYGDKSPCMNHCIALDTCDKIDTDNTIIESYKTEKDVLLAWQKLIQKENPDIIIGYNIFGFDYQFMFKRAKETNCLEEFLKLSRNKNDICATRAFDYKTQRYKEYKLEESTLNIASGQHELRYIKMNGRLQVDLYNYYRRESNLTSYKLDYVAGHFIGDFVKKIDKDTANNTSTIQSSNLTGLLVGSFIHLEEIGHSVEYYQSGAKFIVQSIDKATKSFVIEGVVTPDEKKKIRWCLAKDDVTPKDIFRLTNGTSADRAIVAKYCIQDCNLVHYLFNKSDVLTGFIEMSKICSVPINFLVMRGQGIKLTSYIAKKCRDKKTLMPVIEKGSLNEGYEGAIVLEPKCDLYLDNPVACVDYASLYPSSMISENLSHDSKVWTKEYDLDGNLIKETGDKDKVGNYIYDNLDKYEYVDITYDTYKYVRKTPSSAAEKVKCGTKTCRFAQFKDGKAIMPSILEELLKARKSTRKLISNEKDDFMKQVLEQRQLGYKLTANSLYGQCGAKTSTFYEKDIAACTTATGRKLLTYAQRVIEETYGNKICDTKDYGKVMSKAEYIYGDTDSVFFTFNLETLDGTPIRGKKALEITIELAQEAGEVASSFLKKPHDLEYEKTFMPFCLLSKKRYVGMLYEIDPNKGKRKEMGIVLKRRDNAPIVKDIYGGIIDILMKEQNISKAVEYLKVCLQNMVDEKYPIDKLIITKSLRGYYKNPKSIAHKVLADRIAEREPGNKPSSGDRIPYVYINTKNTKALQGEKIETPVFIRENNINIDYSFYISNQIMKPVSQVFSLVLEKIWNDSKKIGKIKKFNSDIKNLRMTCDESKFDSKLEQLKTKEVKALLFDNYLRVTNNKKQGNISIKDMFIKMNKK